MIITIRELNAFGNVLEQVGKRSLSKEMHTQVLRMVELKVNEVDIKDDDPEGRHLCKLIKEAEGFLQYQRTLRKRKDG